MSPESSSAVPAAKTRPKLAAVRIEGADLSLLRECFNQRGIETVIVPYENYSQRLSQQQFEAVALKLDDSAEGFLNALRASPLNRHAIVYGIADSLQNAQPFFKFGLNSLLVAPLDRQAVSDAVTATHRLLNRELRTFARVHLVTGVEVVAEGQRDQGTTWELSGGGMSLRSDLQVSVGQKLDLTFALPGTRAVTLAGVVSWIQPGMIGVRFDRSDSRDIVRNWLYEYLEMM